MNLFKQYGIKEVADVVFYSITKVGDEEFYTPVLVLDTLKVSTIEKSAEKVTANGGHGNKKLITWNFGKELTLNLEDALFSPASMSLIWGGKLNAEFTDYTSAIVKGNLANKYGSLNYSVKAYPSPALTDEEWELIFRAATETQVPSGRIAAANDPEAAGYTYWIKNYNGDIPYIEENRTILRRRYFKRLWVEEYVQETQTQGAPTSRRPFTENDFNSVKSFTTYTDLNEWFQGQPALPEVILAKIFTYINELNKLGTIETEIYDTEVIDRMEKCIVKNKNGLVISTAEQKKNLLKLYRNDQSSSYVIYYDAKTMLPLLSVTDEGFISGWDSADNGQAIYDKDFDKKTDVDKFRIKQGTIYYKWSRTIKRKTGVDDGTLGKTFVIDAETFPDTYKIVGETYIREQKTGKDQKYQFVINRAQVSSNTSISLQAEGDPTTFEMQIDVLTPPNDIQMELKQIDVEEDVIHGGTRVVPQKARYTYTPTDIIEEKTVPFTNDELY